MVKGEGGLLAAGVDLGFDFAVVGEAAFLQFGENQLAIETEFELPPV